MLPKISCICISSKRVGSLKRALDCYRMQSYSNRELVLLYDEADHETKSFVELLEDNDFIFICISDSDNLTLGEKRNRAVMASTGAYFCTWDDDDWYHDTRLEYQIQAVLYHCKPASILFTLIIFDVSQSMAFVSHARPWEGSLLCKKDLLLSHNIWFENVDNCEDKPFVAKLLALDLVVPLSNPRLYIYARTGHNTSGDYHFDQMIACSTKLNDQHQQTIRNIFSREADLSLASINLDDPVFLRDLNLIPKLFGH